MKATNSHKTRQARRFKPLSQSQENALVLLLQGASDGEVAADPGVHVERTTVWSWRHEHPLFQAELQQRRANLYGSACERLRSLVSKAVANIAGAIEEGNVPMSVELLKIIGLHGNGTMNAVHGLDPESNFTKIVERRLADEKIPGHLDDLLIKLDDNPRKAQREAEIRAELAAEYLEFDEEAF
jgi:hypothetical protein